MLLLVSTSDKIQIVTDTAGQLNVHASWVDHNAGTITPDRKNTDITTATTTDVVLAPASSTQRNVQTLVIRNRSSSVASLTLQHTDGTTVVQLYAGILLAGDQLVFMDGVGFQLTSAVDTQVRVRLATDFNTSSTTAAQVTGLVKTVPTGSWVFRYTLVYQSASTGTGLKVSVNFSGTSTFFVANYRWVDTNAAASTSPDQDVTTSTGSIMSAWSARAGNTTGFTGVGVDTANADMLMIIEGVFNATTSGNVELYAGTEVAASQVTIVSGSALWLEAYGG